MIYWIFPILSSVLYTFIIFLCAYWLIFSISTKLFLKLQKQSTLLRSLIIILSALCVAVLSASPQLYKIYEQSSLMSIEQLILYICAFFISACIMGVLHVTYLACKEKDDSSGKVIFISLFILPLLFSFGFGGIYQGLVFRDDFLKLFTNQIALSVEGEGDVALLKKYPELIDKAYVHSQKYKLTAEGMLSKEDIESQAEFISQLIHDKQTKIYEQASDELVLEKFKFMVSLFRTATAKNPKNCISLIFLNTTEHIIGKDKDINGRLSNFDQSSVNIIEKTDLTEDPVSFDTEKAISLLESSMPEEMKEEGVVEPNNHMSPTDDELQKKCLAYVKHLNDLDQLPEAERVLVARYIFTGSSRRTHDADIQE